MPSNRNRQEGARRHCPCSGCIGNTELYASRTIREHLAAERAGRPFRTRAARHDARRAYAIPAQLPGALDVEGIPHQYNEDALLDDPMEVDTDELPQQGVNLGDNHSIEKPNLTFYRGEEDFFTHVYPFAKLKAKTGMSNATFDKLMPLVCNLIAWVITHPEDLEIIPRKWRKMLQLLEDIDYRPPKTYYICMDDSHAEVTASLNGCCPSAICKNGRFHKPIKTRSGVTFNPSRPATPDPVGSDHEGDNEFGGDLSNGAAADNEAPDEEGMAVPEDPTLTPAPIFTIEEDSDADENYVIGPKGGKLRLTPADHLMPYEYISLKHRMRRLFFSSQKSYDLLAMWRAKDRWFNLPEDHHNDLLNETWDGRGMREHSYFFDPTKKYTLPQRCPIEACRKPIAAKLLEESNHVDGQCLVSCPSCLRKVQVPYERVFGDPRNLVIQFHADAFETASSSNKQNLDAMTVTFLNMTKLNRSHQANVFLCGFIRQTIEDRKTHAGNPAYLRAFYKPFLDELIDLYIDGMEVDYSWTEPSLEKAGIRPGKARVRVMMVNHSGDYPALQELACVKCKGYIGCRICEYPSEYTPLNARMLPVPLLNTTRFPANRASDQSNAVYYVNARRHLATTLPLRDFKKVVNTALRLEKMVRGSKAWEELAKKTGVTGLSPFYLLTLLHGYNYLHNALADGMHNPTNEGKMLANHVNEGGKPGTLINPNSAKKKKKKKKSTPDDTEDQDNQGGQSSDSSESGEEQGSEESESEEDELLERPPPPKFPLAPLGSKPAKNGGRELFVDWERMKRKMGEFPTPTELKDGRWPTPKTMTAALGYWKCKLKTHDSEFHVID